MNVLAVMPLGVSECLHCTIAKQSGQKLIYLSSRLSGLEGSFFFMCNTHTHTHTLIIKQVNESSQVMLTFCLQKTLQKNTRVERILVQNTTTFPRAISNNVTLRPELAAVRGAGHSPENSYQCDEIVRRVTGVCVCVCWVGEGRGGGQISCTTLIVHAQHRSRATAQPTQLSIVYKQCRSAWQRRQQENTGFHKQAVTAMTHFVWEVELMQ